MELDDALPLTEQGRFLARVQGPVSGNVLLRRQQYRIADGAEMALSLVRTIVTAKVANSRVVLLRSAREITIPSGGPGCGQLQTGFLGSAWMPAVP